MVARDSTGARRRRIRLDANRPRTHPNPASRLLAKAGAAATQHGDCSAHLNGQRARLFKAMSIVACCRLACASLLDGGDDNEVMADALQAAHDLIAATAAELPSTGDVPGEPTAPES
jgi:hypothetical protein